MEKVKHNTGANLKEVVGLIDKDDKEYDEILKELKVLYKKWTRDVNKYEKF